MSASPGAVRWPPGISGAGVSCGIKRSRQLDLGLLVAEPATTWAGAFTRNGAAAPSVHWNRRLLGRQVRAVVANSGNANACTGEEGRRAVETTAAAVARSVGCDASEILVASTGPIGVALEVDRIVDAIPAAVDSLDGDTSPFSSAILTTDKTTKIAREVAGAAEIVGVAKGAAMLAPNMATMLAFVATDAGIDHPTLQGALCRAIERSFNRICVDACESTNDTVLCLATGRAGEVEPGAFSDALGKVCASLAAQIARDAEGSTRLVRINVVGAADEPEAVALGRAVAASALWRAAVHGSDPNWGRVVAALGASNRSLDLSSVSIAIGSELLYARGEPVGSLESARLALTPNDVEVTCTVGRGRGDAQILSSDLSTDYVTLNAFDTT